MTAVLDKNILDVGSFFLKSRLRRESCSYPQRLNLHYKTINTVSSSFFCDFFLVQLRLQPFLSPLSPRPSDGNLPRSLLVAISSFCSAVLIGCHSAWDPPDSTLKQPIAKAKWYTPGTLQVNTPVAGLKWSCWLYRTSLKTMGWRVLGGQPTQLTERQTEARVGISHQSRSRRLPLLVLAYLCSRFQINRNRDDNIVKAFRLLHSKWNQFFLSESFLPFQLLSSHWSEPLAQASLPPEGSAFSWI